jgi:hypothetical protein
MGLVIALKLELEREREERQGRTSCSELVSYGSWPDWGMCVQRYEAVRSRLTRASFERRSTVASSLHSTRPD